MIDEETHEPVPTEDASVDPVDPTDTAAHRLAENPTKDIKHAMGEAVKASAASESLATIRFHQEDGSVLLVCSREGDDAELRAYANENEWMQDGEV